MASHFTPLVMCINVYCQPQKSKRNVLPININLIMCDHIIYRLIYVTDNIFKNNYYKFGERDKCTNTRMKCSFLYKNKKLFSF